MWQPGQVILDEYEVVKPLGAGGMATVYLVRQRDRGALLAAKVPHERFLQAADDRLAFAREVQVWISLPPHPNIVQCHFVRDVGGVMVIFAEYLAGGTLADWQARQRLHGPAHVLDLAIQLAEAMQAAHDLRVVHKDIKPTNCLMDEAGTLKVTDFGLAAARQAVLERRGRAEGPDRDARCLAAGTPAYCSPEQFDGAPVDARTDVWSFGVTLLELLAGRRPIVGPAARASLEAHLATPASSAVPMQLWDFLLAILEPDLEKRPASFSAVGAGLKALYEQLTSRPYARRIPEHGPPREPAPQARPVGHHASRALLARALRHTGRDPSEAEAFHVSTPVGARPHEANLLAEIALLAEAARLYRQAMAGTESERLVLELCGVLHQIALARKTLGDLGDAIAAFDEVVARLRGLMPKTQDQRVPAMLAETICNQAVCHRQRGNLEAAINGYAQGIALFRSADLARFGAPVLNEVAAIYQNRAMALLKAQRLNEALHDVNKAVKAREALVQRVSRRSYGVDLAGTYCNRGVLHRNMGNLAAAVEDYDRAIALCSEQGVAGSMAEDEDTLALAHLDRGVARAAMGNLTAAGEDFGKAIELFARLAERTGAGSQIENLARAYNDRALLHRTQGDTERALADIQQSIQLREQAVDQRGMAHAVADLAKSHLNRALILMDANQPARALPGLERALAWLANITQRRRSAELSALAAKMHVVNGMARCSTGQAEQGMRDIALGADQFGELLHTGSVDIIESYLEALVAQLEIARRTRGSVPLPVSVEASLARLRAALAGRGPVLSAIAGKLRATQALLCQALPPGSQDRQKADALIREMLGATGASPPGQAR